MRIRNFLIFIFFAFVSCDSIVNVGLTQVGVYEDQIRLKTLNYQDKTIVFFPMHHIGTDYFYTDVKNKVDSLIKKDYYFMYEKIDLDRSDQVIMHKTRKIFRLPLTKENTGYKKLLDSLYPNIKYKKILVDQISYGKLGLNTANSERADVDSKQIVNFYESKYGEIKLTDCDWKTSVYQKYSKCKEENRVPKKQSEDALIHFRNNWVAQKIKETSHSKIAVIYGEEHIEGIMKKLSEQKNN